VVNTLQPPRHHECQVSAYTSSLMRPNKKHSAYCRTCNIGCLYLSKENAHDGARQHEQSNGRTWS
jgi:hypothetical protein